MIPHIWISTKSTWIDQEITVGIKGSSGYPRVAPSSDPFDTFASFFLTWTVEYFRYNKSSSATGTFCV